MHILRFGAALIGLVMLVMNMGEAVAAAPSARGESAAVIGSWIDKLPDGSAMMITFTPYAVTFHTLDTRGLGNGPPTTIQVSYAKQNNGSLMLTPTGEVGEPMAVRVNGPDVMVIQFEGMQPRTLVRQKEEEQPKPANPHGK